VPPEVFMDAMARFCKVVRIKTKIIGEKLYLLDVQLAQGKYSKQSKATDQVRERVNRAHDAISEALTTACASVPFVAFAAITQNSEAMTSRWCVAWTG
jgi:hypothetical protein